MSIAYLINQYPKVSHSFIRREILALESLGVEVFRYSHRAVPMKELADAGDRTEREKTIVLLDAGVLGLLFSTFSLAIQKPLQFFAAMHLAVSMGRKSRLGVIKHCIYLAEACFLYRLLSGSKVSHIHAHFGTNSTTVAMFCSMLGGQSYSFTVHGPEEFDDPVGLALEVKIQHSKFVVAVSSFGRSQLMRQCHHDQWDKIKVVHCTVDDSFLAIESGPIPATPRLVCIGRLCEQKGQLLLLDALHMLDKEGISFEMILAGDGEMRGVVEERIRKFNLQDKVRITGWISGEQVRNEIIASRAMVLPSFAEGLPVVIMEALALQRPVVSTYIAGIPELIESGVNGWLVPAGSVDHLVDALKKVLRTDDTANLQKMGEEGAKRVAVRHNSKLEAKQLKHLFEYCLPDK